MGDTEMKPSAFVAINDHQQIEKYNGLNTYNLYLRDTDRVGYVAGDANLGQHNSFTLQIPDNQSGHITRAMCRLKFIGIPITPGLAVDYGYGFVRTNFVRNCYSSSLGFNNSILGGFKIDEVCVVEQTAVPAITTTGGVPAAGGTFTQAGATNQGAVFDTTTGQQVESEHGLAVGVVSQATYNLPSKTSLVAKVGHPLSDNWVLCDNPFGKTLSFEIVGEDFRLPLELGHSAAESTIICLEVKLLPDNQANDRFSY